MLGGMVVAFVVIVLAAAAATCRSGNAVDVAGALGKMNVVDLSPQLDNRYTFWSGLTGGCFLALAYFGTDQSQVQRYLSGRSLTESRLGLLFNGLLKVPMQFLILFVGVMVFVFYQFTPPPLLLQRAALRARRRRRRTRPSCARSRRSGRGVQADKRAEADALAGGARRRATRAADRGAAARAPGRRAAGRRASASEAKAADRPRRCRARRPRTRDYVFLSLRDARLAARARRPAAGGHPVRRHVVDRQRAERAGRDARRSTSTGAASAARPPTRHYLRAAKLLTVVWGAARGGLRRASRRCSTT